MRSPTSIIAAFGILAVFIGGAAFDRLFFSSKKADCGAEYSYINADVVCGKPDVVSKASYATAQDRISEFIETKRREGNVSEASVYFRDLNHGPIFNINELADFAPASLLKLPLALVYFASAEVQPELLEKKLQYIGTTTVDEQRVRPRMSAEPNHPYPIEELLRMMLAYSDNASYETLEQFLANDPHRVEIRRTVLQELGLINPESRVEETVTVRGYASLFRILYNVSYLDVAYSEKVLRWLSEHNYQAGLRAGVPGEIVVASKFGERISPETDDKQLHDCGIVYYPDNPYLLCIMTRGDEWNKLEEVIGAISRMVWEEVSSRRL